MLLLSDLPGIAPQAALEQGEASGTTDVIIVIGPERRWDFSVDADNHGSRSTGEVRFGLLGRVNSPLRLGDNLDARIQLGSGGGLTYGRLGYELPVGGDGTRIGAAYSRLEYELGKDFADLDGSGQADVVELTLTHPLIRSRARNLFGKIGWQEKWLDDRLSGDETGKRIRTFNIGLAYEQRDRLLGGGYTSANLTAFFGDLRFDSQVLHERDAARQTEGHFEHWNYTVSRLNALTGRMNLFFGITGQFTDKNLDSAEKIALGGPRAVRAYAPAEATVDEGHVANLELRYSLLPEVSVHGFYDWGWGRFNRRPLAGDVEQRNIACADTAWAPSGATRAALPCAPASPGGRPHAAAQTQTACRGCISNSANRSDASAGDDRAQQEGTMNKKIDMNFQPRPSAIGLAFALAFGSASTAWALPTGEQVVAGQVSVGRPNAGNMVIQQGTPSAIVNWNSFSIGGSEAVRIQQPGASSVILNRVLGNSPSDIYGQLSANGKVFLVNPNGVLFGRSASVDVGSLVASTLSIGNADFLAGRYSFGGSGGSVVNQGTITAAERGTIALLGGTVHNDGTITAKLGTAALGAGSQITLDLAGDGLSKLTISQAALDAQVANGGAIVADGGQVLLSTRSLDALASSVVNQTGSVRARSLVERNGRIVLDGGEAGVTLVSGSVDATGSQYGASGGEIQVLGHHVGLVGNATLDASGAAGGGTLLVGGDYQGKNASVRNAQATFVGRDATLRADATDNGDGGKVIVWGDDATRAYGSLSARGGANGGNGGLIETSGEFLDTDRR